MAAGEGMRPLAVPMRPRTSVRLGLRRCGPRGILRVPRSISDERLEQLRDRFMVASGTVWSVELDHAVPEKPRPWWRRLLTRTR